MRIAFLRIFLVTIFLVASAEAFQIPPLTGPVMDQAGVIDAASRTELETFLQALNTRGKAQVQVLVVETLDGMPLEEASIKIVDQYKLGTASKDNGALLLVVTKDRLLRIEVGQGLEGDLTDLASKRITSDVIKPFFKAGRYAEGIKAGVFAIASKVDPESSGTNAGPSAVAWSGGEEPKIFKWLFESDNPASIGRKIEMFGFVIFVLLFIISSGFRSAIGGGRGFGRSSSWGGGGGWGGGSSRGGSSWGGGGGGFSGGGASDSW